MVKISIISALSDNFVIGNQGDLPWHIPEDFKIFKEITKGKPVIMGRKTWESLPKKPLPGRLNIVISREPSFWIPEALVSQSLEDAISLASKKQPEIEEIIIIGGAQIYKQALDSNIVDTLYLSQVKGEYDGDTFFPEFNLKKFKIFNQREFKEFTFKEFQKINT